MLPEKRIDQLADLWRFDLETLAVQVSKLAGEPLNAEHVTEAACQISRGPRLAVMLCGHLGSRVSEPDPVRKAKSTW